MSTAERILTGTKDDTGQEPEWIALQEEIYTRLNQLKQLTELGVTGGLDDSLDEVNRKVERYNELVPAVLMKPKVTRESFVSQLPLWK